MRTYRELFGTPEFTPYFLTSAAGIGATTLSGLALSTLVFDRTASPLLSALALLGPSLAQLVGMFTLMSSADRLPPRAVLTSQAALGALGTAAQAIPRLPVWAIFAILLAVGAVSSLGSGARGGLLKEIVGDDGYVLGRSVINMTAGTMQVLGFAVGGALVLLLSARLALVVAALVGLLAAALARFGLSRRAPRVAGRPSIAATWRANAQLWSAPARRAVLLALWVPNGLIVGCESLYIAYSPRYAAVLFALGAAGMLTGDTVTGRFLSARQRARIAPWLRLQLPVPYLIFAFHPPLILAGIAVALGTAGYAASLLLQERLLALTPGELSGHALGLSFAGMLAAQGIAAAVAGGIAELTSPAVAMTILAGASLLITVLLAPSLRTPVSSEPAAASSG